MKISNILSFGINAAFVGVIGSIAWADVKNTRNDIALAEFLEQQQCMAMNIYHEARSDGKLGQKAVGFVTLNRVQSKRYPSTPCDVVYQAQLNANGKPKRNKCQFSWYCDGKKDDPNDKVFWEIAKQMAYEVMTDYGNVEDPTDGATMYHASYVNPNWAKDYERTVRIDTHIFYK